MTGWGDETLWLRNVVKAKRWDGETGADRVGKSMEPAFGGDQRKRTITSILGKKEGDSREA